MFDSISVHVCVCVCVCVCIGCMCASSSHLVVRSLSFSRVVCTSRLLLARTTKSSPSNALRTCRAEIK